MATFTARRTYWGLKDASWFRDRGRDSLDEFTDGGSVRASHQDNSAGTDCTAAVVPNYHNRNIPGFRTSIIFPNGSSSVIDRFRHFPKYPTLQSSSSLVPCTLSNPKRPFSVFRVSQHHNMPSASTNLLNRVSPSHSKTKAIFCKTPLFPPYSRIVHDCSILTKGIRAAADGGNRE